MAPPILASKLYVPPVRPDAVARPRLVQRLNEGLRGGPILVSAPAGFGKTTALCQWVRDAGRSMSVAWLSLDGADSDPARFMAYLVAALRTADEAVGLSVLDMLGSGEQPAMQEMVTALLNDIEGSGREVILILDDYHVIGSEPVHRGVEFLLEHLPPQLHLVIATREDPVLPLARWRAQAGLTEVRAADLRFGPAEVAEFLRTVMGLRLAEGEVAVLDARTEGWIVGLQLAALSLRAHPDPSAFIAAFTGSNRFVLDYLVAEVLRAQPDDVRDFLLRTAVLDRMCGPLCDAVTGQEHGTVMLERLERDNLFIVALDDQRRWWRYHHLFADVLEVYLQQDLPDEVPELHRRASGWFERNDMPSEAVEHALRARDGERAARLIEVAGLMTEDSSQAGTWIGWVSALPDEVIRARPVLSAWYACALLGRGDLEAAEARLRDAERGLDPGDDLGPADEEQLRALLATISVVRAYNAQSTGDVVGAVAYARRVFDLVPEGDHLRREQASALLGMAYWAGGDLRAAERTLADYVHRMHAVGNLADAVSAACVLAEIRVVLGRLREAEARLQRALARVLNRGEPFPVEVADAHRALAELAMQRGDLARAGDHLEKSMRLGADAGSPAWRYRWFIASARLEQMCGDTGSALDLLDEAARTFVRTPLPQVRPIDALTARLWIARGRGADALRWAAEHGLGVDDHLDYLREFEHLTLARALIVGNGGNRAGYGLDLLQRLLRAAEQGGRAASVVEILLVQAWAHQCLGDTTAACESLWRALCLAEPEGYAGVFIGEGPDVARLVTESASRVAAPLCARRFAAQVMACIARQAVLRESTVARPGQLSDREREVVELIAAGLTNSEIADRLFISPYTVKAHARSIYDKLDVHSRTQAVARARQIGVLRDADGTS